MATIESTTEIRPFSVEVPEEDLADLRKRIAATRWPEKETVADETQGVQLATMEELVRYWGTEYDFGRVESRLSAFPQFMTEIDGLDIHFIHVKSPHDDALPLLITHGWPGSIIEMLNVIGPLSDPTAHGGDAEDAFDVVVPSMPGYGFSGKPTATGWDPVHIAETLGSGGPAPSGLSADESRAWEQLNFLYTKGIGYATEMNLRPQTLYGLADSPVALAAWMLDHDARSYEDIARAFDGDPVGNLTPDEVLDNITLTWVTNTGISSGRLYWENTLGFFDVKGVSVPAAVSVFPRELYRAPRSWTEQAYPKLIYFNEVDEGNHFAAWQEPELFTQELRAAFRPLRTTKDQGRSS